MIKRSKIFGWLLLGAILVSTSGIYAQTIFQSLKWNNRVLVLSAGERAGDMQEQVLLFEPLFDDLEERDLIVLQLRSQVLEKVPDLSPFPFETKILENRQERRYLEDLFQSDIDVLKVSLIGLDGEIKSSWEGVTDPQEIFDAIDAMPMRKRDINNK